MNAPTCPDCGSDQIVVGITIGLSAEAGRVGLSYDGPLLLTGTEPLLADLCDQCGTVVRLRVAKVGRKWIVRK